MKSAIIGLTILILAAALGLIYAICRSANVQRRLEDVHNDDIWPVQ